MVTGANYLVETDKLKFLVDCGMIQGEIKTDELNAIDFPYAPDEIDFVLITHAHLDHIGRLPKLIRNGFRGKIYATPPTIDLSSLILKDSLKIAREEAKHYPKRMLFCSKDIAVVSQNFTLAEYGREITPADGVKIIFRNAGHILGSAIIEVIVEEAGKSKKIVFSGDLGNPPTPLLPPYDMIDGADYMLVESAYGDRNHENKELRKHKLEDIIEETIKRKGVLLIPTFALERTQELLFELNELVENNRIPKVRIFIDGPLSIEATEIYKKYQNYFNKEARYIIDSGDDIFKFPGLEFTKTPEESKKINDAPPPKIIIAGSGMSQGGRILHHELRYLSDPNNTMLVITYQVKGTRGRKIFNGEPSVHIFGQEVPVKINIKAVGGYSAHADQRALVKWVRKSKKTLKKVFVVQGEPGPAEALKQVIADHLGISAMVPEGGQVFEL